MMASLRDKLARLTKRWNFERGRGVGGRGQLRRREFGIKYSPPQTVHPLPPILVLNTQISVIGVFSQSNCSACMFLGRAQLKVKDKGQNINLIHEVCSDWISNTGSLRVAELVIGLIAAYDSDMIVTTPHISYQYQNSIAHSMFHSVYKIEFEKLIQLNVYEHCIGALNLTLREDPSHP